MKPITIALSVLLLAPDLAARGESLAAFDGRCILAGCVASPLNTPGILPPRALRCGRGPQRGSRVGDPGRLAALGASPYL